MSGRNKRQDKRQNKNPCFMAPAPKQDKTYDEWVENVRSKWKDTCIKDLTATAFSELVPWLEVTYVSDVSYENPMDPDNWPDRNQWAEKGLAENSPFLKEFKRVVTYIQEQEKKGPIDKTSPEFLQFIEDFFDRARAMISEDKREFITAILESGRE